MYRLAGAGPRKQLLVVEAVWSLFVASLTSQLVPFGRFSRRFGDFVPPDDPRTAPTEFDQRQRDRVRAIGWAVRASAPWMPFRAVCLQQAMAAQAMLARRGIDSVMRFGAAKGDVRAIDGHAWLSAGNVRVTGFPLPPRVRELGAFVPRPRGD